MKASRGDVIVAALRPRAWVVCAGGCEMGARKHRRSQFASNATGQRDSLICGGGGCGQLARGCGVGAVRAPGILKR